jgi:hypothetical protein
MGLKGHSLNDQTLNEFNNTKYKYLNYLAETNFYDKIHKYNKAEESNTKLLNDYINKSNIIANAGEQLKEEENINYYIEYLRQKKKLERKESLGASQSEESLYDEVLNKYKENLIEQSQVSLSPSEMLKLNDEEKKDKINYEAIYIKEGFDDSGGNRYNQTDATYFKNEIDTVFPYYDKPDYDFEDLLGEDYMDGSKPIY